MYLLPHKLSSFSPRLQPQAFKGDQTRRYAMLSLNSGGILMYPQSVAVYLIVLLRVPVKAPAATRDTGAELSEHFG